MSTQHTPGPWNFYTEPQPNGCPLVGSRGLMVAMLAHTVNQDDQRETALANARLISAAPDLLEACQNFSEWLRREDEGFVTAGRDRSTPEGEAEWRKWFYENLRLCKLAQQQVHAAIAKAGGLHGQC